MTSLSADVPCGSSVRTMTRDDPVDSKDRPRASGPSFEDAVACAQSGAASVTKNSTIAPTDKPDRRMLASSSEDAESRHPLSTQVGAWYC